MTPTRPTVVSLVAVVCALGLSACTPVPDAETAPSAASGRAVSPPASADSDDEGESAVTAVNTAEASASGRAFTLERDDDGSWDVHVAAGEREVDVRVSSDGTSVQDTRDHDDIDARERAAVSAAVTTLADAIRIAAAQNTGGERLDEVQLENRSGTWVWQVELRSGTTVRIGAADGAVVSTGR